MRQKTNYILIGGFVVVASSLAVIGAVMLGAGALSARSLILETYIKESVTGLDVGAHVRFRGVKIGSVTEISHTSLEYPEDSLEPWVLVRFAIRPQSKAESIRDINEIVTARLGDGLRTRLASQGLTGTLYLEADLYPESDDTDPIEVTWIPKYRYIPSIPSTTTRITSSLEGLLGNLSTTDFRGLVDDIKTTMHTLDEAVASADLPGLSNRVQAVAGSASGTLDKIDAAVASLTDQSSDVIGSVKTSLERIDTTVARLGADGRETLGSVKQTFDALDADELRRLVADLRIFVEGLEPTRVTLEQTVAQLNGALQGRGRQVDQILENVRRITVGFANLADTLEQYPSLLLFGNPPPRSDR